LKRINGDPELSTTQVSKWDILGCGGKRSATPLWKKIAPGIALRKRCRRYALPAQSKSCHPTCYLFRRQAVVENTPQSPLLRQ
jgi:hypothetical protein